MAISFDTILFVIGQSLVIIVFYLLVWKIEPFSTKFVKNVEQVRRSLLREKIPSWAITLLFFLGFLLSVLLFMTAIILFPGITVNTFLTRSGLSELGSLVALLAVLAVSQYFIVRSIHGSPAGNLPIAFLIIKKEFSSSSSTAISRMPPNRLYHRTRSLSRLSFSNQKFTRYSGILFLAFFRSM